MKRFLIIMTMIITPIVSRAEISCYGNVTNCYGSFENCRDNSFLSCTNDTCVCSACAEGYGSVDGGKSCFIICMAGWCKVGTQTTNNGVVTTWYELDTSLYPYPTDLCYDSANGHTIAVGSYCQNRTTYRCAEGFYGSPTSSNSGCTQCGTIYGIQSESAAGSTSCTSCCVPANSTGSNDTGTFRLKTECCFTSC